METIPVKMMLFTNMVFFILYVQHVDANSMESSSTHDTFTANSAASTMDIISGTADSNSTPMSTMEMSTLLSTESPSTTDGNSSTVTQTDTPATTSVTTVSSMSSPTETTPPSTTMLSSPPGTTPVSTVSSMETTMTPNDTSPTMATAGLVLGQTETIAISVGGGALLLVLAIIVTVCICKKCGGTSNRPLSEIDEDDAAHRMSMHRPESSVINSDGDRAFLTFTGKRNEVDGIVNPTYSTTAFDEIPNNNRGGDGDNVYATDEGSATIPSKARLAQNSNEGKPEASSDDKRDVEGAVDDSEVGKEDVVRDSLAVEKEGEVRPISGISYKSEDIELALEVLDVGTV